MLLGDGETLALEYEFATGVVRDEETCGLEDKFVAGIVTGVVTGVVTSIVTGDVGCISYSKRLSNTVLIRVVKHLISFLILALAWNSSRSYFIPFACTVIGISPCIFYFLHLSLLNWVS